MFFKRIDRTGGAAFCFGHQIVQHRLGCDLVFRQRNATVDAVFVTITTPPRIGAPLVQTTSEPCVEETPAGIEPA